MAQLVYMKLPDVSLNNWSGDSEGVVIDTEDTPNEKLNEEYAPYRVERCVRLPDDCSEMPCDRLLTAE